MSGVCSRKENRGRRFAQFIRQGYACWAFDPTSSQRLSLRSARRPKDNFPSPSSTINPDVGSIFSQGDPYSHPIQKSSDFRTSRRCQNIFPADSRPLLPPRRSLSCLRASGRTCPKVRADISLIQIQKPIFASPQSAPVFVSHPGPPTELHRSILGRPERLGWLQPCPEVFRATPVPPLPFVPFAFFAAQIISSIALASSSVNAFRASRAIPCVQSQYSG